ncbi:MAG TPA: adenylate/guanylate cyclase domain-containing protein [Nevskiaceae bacterium]|nr:adenylate/guanylate cyclase domain-containing protein [Nevskiaceae bacterium]
MIITLLLVVTGGLTATVVYLRRRVQTVSARLAAATTELERVQQACTLLAPSGVIQRVLSEGLVVAPERRVATVMFKDLVGYTAMSEKLDAAQVSRVLDGYFQLVSDAVVEHRGHVGTFLGDGILVYFGALEPNPWQCNDAVRAALAIRAAVVDYSRQLQSEGLPAVSIGVGLHRGPGVSGLVGSRDRREYAFIGLTTNIAARVQSLTREQGTDILFTEAVREKLDPRFALRQLPARPVKGVAEPVVTYAVEGEKEAE